MIKTHRIIIIKLKTVDYPSEIKDQVNSINSNI